VLFVLKIDGVFGKKKIQLKSAEEVVLFTDSINVILFVLLKKIRIVTKNK